MLLICSLEVDKELMDNLITDQINHQSEQIQENSEDNTNKEKVIKKEKKREEAKNDVIYTAVFTDTSGWVTWCGMCGKHSLSLLEFVK